MLPIINSGNHPIHSSKRLNFLPKTAPAKSRHSTHPIVYCGLPRDLTKFLKENEFSAENRKPNGSVEYSRQIPIDDQELVQLSFQEDSVQTLRRGKTMLEFRTVHRAQVPSQDVRTNVRKVKKFSADGTHTIDRGRPLVTAKSQEMTTDGEQMRKINELETELHKYQQGMTDMQYQMDDLSRKWEREKSVLTKALELAEAKSQSAQAMAGEAVDKLEKLVHVVENIQNSQKAETTNFSLLNTRNYRNFIEKAQEDLERTPSTSNFVDPSANVTTQREEEHVSREETLNDQTKPAPAYDEAMFQQHNSTYQLMLQLRRQVLDVFQTNSIDSSEKENLASHEPKSFDSASVDIETVMNESIAVLRGVLACVNVLVRSDTPTSSIHRVLSLLRNSREDQNHLEKLLTNIKQQHDDLSNFVNRSSEKWELQLNDVRMQLTSLTETMTILQKELSTISSSVTTEKSSNGDNVAQKRSIAPVPQHSTQISNQIQSRQTNDFRMEPTSQKNANPVDNPTLWFTQREYMRNSATLKRALIENRLSAMAYKNALRKMEEYCQVPAERLAILVRKYMSMKSMQFIAEYVRTNGSLNDRVFQLLDRVEQVAEKRQSRYKEIMKFWEEERILRAQRLIQVCETIENKSTIFLIKPTTNQYSREWLRETFELQKRARQKEKTFTSLTTKRKESLDARFSPIEINVALRKTNRETEHEQVKQNKTPEYVNQLSFLHKDGVWNSEVSSQKVSCEIDETPKIIELDISRSLWPQTMASASIQPMQYIIPGRELLDSAAPSQINYDGTSRPSLQHVPSWTSDVKKSAAERSQENLEKSFSHMEPRLQRESTFMSLPSSEAQSYVVVQRSPSKVSERATTTQKTWSDIESPNFHRENLSAFSVTKSSNERQNYFSQDYQGMDSVTHSPIRIHRENVAQRITLMDENPVETNVIETSTEQMVGENSDEENDDLLVDHGESQDVITGQITEASMEEMERNENAEEEEETSETSPRPLKD